MSRHSLVAVALDQSHDFEETLRVARQARCSVPVVRQRGLRAIGRGHLSGSPRPRLPCKRVRAINSGHQFWPSIRAIRCIQDNAARCDGRGLSSRSMPMGPDPVQGCRTRCCQAAATGLRFRLAR